MPQAAWPLDEESRDDAAALPGGDDTEKFEEKGTGELTYLRQPSKKSHSLTRKGHRFKLKYRKLFEPTLRTIDEERK